MSFRRKHLLDRKNAIRAGFGLVLALGLFSTIEAGRIQSDLSTATEDIYKQHIEQDEVRFELRRTLWTASSAGRDYLLNPSASREVDYVRLLAPLRFNAYRLLSRLEARPESAHLKAQTDDFWRILEGLPRTTAPLDTQSRYLFVQEQVAERRNQLGDTLREWDRSSHDSLSDGHTRFEESRSFAARRLFWILGLSLLAAAAVALLSLRYSERMEKQAAAHHRQVVEAKDELTRLSTRLMEVQEQERANLSRELHDEIGQGLATLRLEVARAEALPPQRLSEIRERLGRARLLTDSIVQTVRNICLLLRPSMLDDLGLIPAIQWLAQDFQRRTGVICRFSSGDVGEDLPEPMRTCVYRVVQESLHNCEKHAEAQNVTVRVSERGDRMLAVIEDDGKGFDTGAVPSGRGFGIMGMRERAIAAAGSLAVESAPRRGTRVELSLPVAPGAKKLPEEAAARI